MSDFCPEYSHGSFSLEMPLSVEQSVQYSADLLVAFSGYHLCWPWKDSGFGQRDLEVSRDYNPVPH